MMRMETKSVPDDAGSSSSSDEETSNETMEECFARLNALRIRKREEGEGAPPPRRSLREQTVAKRGRERRTAAAAADDTAAAAARDPNVDDVVVELPPEATGDAIAWFRRRLELSEARCRSLEVELRNEREEEDRRRIRSRPFDEDEEGRLRKELEWTIDALERSERRRRRAATERGRLARELEERRGREGTLLAELRYLEERNGRLMKESHELRVQLGRFAVASPSEDGKKKVGEVNFSGSLQRGEFGSLRASHETQTTWASTEESAGYILDCSDHKFPCPSQV